MLSVALYIHFSLGTGGDLEITTLESMKSDFRAERAVFAIPVTVPCRSFPRLSSAKAERLEWGVSSHVVPDVHLGLQRVE